MSKRTHTVSSGNGFADLEVAEPAEALAKGKLAHAINRIVSSNGWSQARAA